MSKTTRTAKRHSRWPEQVVSAPSIRLSKMTEAERARHAFLAEREIFLRTTDTTRERTLTSRQRFRNACACQPVDRPPVWLMRQAGRALPEYRKLKETYSFVELVQNPELAAEVTLQPVRRFGFDAAILFSDILVIPEALGQSYRFRETGGVVMDFAVRTRADVEKLSVEGVTERLAYVDKALRLLRRELGEKTALIGFSGSPWTLATFMMEGGSVLKYGRALALFREDRKTYYALAEKLTAAITDYLKMQIAAGVDALQLFDSHGGHLAADEFQEASGRWMKEIIAGIRDTEFGRGAELGLSPAAHEASGGQTLTSPSDTLSHRMGEGRGEGDFGLDRDQVQNEPTTFATPPAIVFSLGTHKNWPDLVGTGANVLGVDWQVSLAEARKLVPDKVALQGNLAPSLMSDSTPDEVARETRSVLDSMRGWPGYIVNLGHGLTPAAKLENIQALATTVQNWR